MTKFLLDAQLPRRLAHALREQGFDVVHTLDLPNGNHTSDSEINLVSLDEQRVVITKDADFVDMSTESGSIHVFSYRDGRCRGSGRRLPRDLEPEGRSLPHRTQHADLAPHERHQGPNECQTESQTPAKARR